VVGADPSCALLGGFAISAGDALLWQHYGNAWQILVVIRQAQRTLHAFRPYCAGVATRTRNVSEYMLVLALCLVTFRVSRRPREMYCGHARLCVCLSAATCLQYCTDLDVTWGSGRGCPLVVHYWADLQSVHGLRCYGNIMEMCGRGQR